MVVFSISSRESPVAFSFSEVEAPSDFFAGPHDRLLNLDQLRRRLNCSKSHVYNLIQMDELPAVTLGASKGKRVYDSAVVEYLDRKQEMEDT